MNSLTYEEAVANLTYSGNEAAFIPASGLRNVISGQSLKRGRRRRQWMHLSQCHKSWIM